MADDKKSYPLTLIQRLWVAKALEVLRKAVIRSRANEIVGSEIYVLRGKEIDDLTALIGMFQS